MYYTSEHLFNLFLSQFFQIRPFLLSQWLCLACLFSVSSSVSFYVFWINAVLTVIMRTVIQRIHVSLAGCTDSLQVNVNRSTKTKGRGHISHVPGFSQSLLIHSLQVTSKFSTWSGGDFLERHPNVVRTQDLRSGSPMIYTLSLVVWIDSTITRLSVCFISIWKMGTGSMSVLCNQIKKTSVLHTSTFKFHFFLCISFSFIACIKHKPNSMTNLSKHTTWPKTLITLMTHLPIQTSFKSCLEKLFDGP